MSKQPIVLITPPNDYKRFVNGIFVDHVQSENRSLTAQEVELFRTDPVKFLSGDDEPEAA